MSLEKSAVNIQAIPADVDALIHVCAWRVMRRVGKCGMQWADMAQEGRLAYLHARHEGRLPADAIHRQSYIARRVTGGIFDAVRTSFRQYPASVGELTDETPQQTSDATNPEQALQAKQAVTQIVRRGGPRAGQIVGMLLVGASTGEVGRAMGISSSRVSQILAAARRAIEHLQVTT